MTHKSTAEPSYDGTHVIMRKKKRNVCDQTPEMPKLLRSNTRNAETSVTKHKKYWNVCDQAEKMLEHARGAHIIFVDCPLSWAFATSHKASSRNLSCVRIHQGSPLSSAADDMEAGRLSS